MAPFRLVPDDFRPLSIEILSDRALGRAAKAGLRLRLSRLSSPCYGLVQGDSLPVISLNHCVNNSSQATDIQSLSCIKSECGEARAPLLAGDNRENSGFGEVAGGARREAMSIDFLSGRKTGVFRRHRSLR